MTRFRRSVLTKLVVAFGLATGCFGGASAQTLNEYLKIRRQYGITQATSVAALETMVGTRICEVRGRVKGTVTVDGKHSLLLERSDGSSMLIACTEIPDWLSNNDTPARLLVRATRPTESSDIKAVLLGAAAEAQIEPLDKAQAREDKRFAKKPVRPVSKKNARSWHLPASQVTPIYANFIKTRNKRLTDREAMTIARGIVGFSIKYGIDARLIMAMVLCESGFDPYATSSKGAQGLGQLMPGTARGMGVSNAYDSLENLNATVRLIGGHLNKYRKQAGSDFEALALALAAYNAGSGAVRRWGGIPNYRQTKAYISKVIGWYRTFCGY